MDWIAASLASAFLLGCYELFTKHAVRENAVMPVLFLSTLFGAVFWAGLIAAGRLHPSAVPGLLAVDPIGPAQHARILLKSAIVASAWTATYFAVRELPVSISSPIRATGPIWTLIGAVAFMAERPRWLQVLGIGTAVGSFVLLAGAGRSEGIVFRTNKWIGWLVAGTVLNAISAMYDRYLFGTLGFTAATVQAWYSVYLAVLFLPLALGWKLSWWPRHAFQWRWSVPLLTVAILGADFVYFDALRNPAALISVVASLRRSSVLVGSAGGILFFRERLNGRKVAAIVGVLAGIALTILG
jgi:drug/metabolite transporter (DMT)-like permease